MINTSLAIGTDSSDSSLIESEQSSLRQGKKHRHRVRRRRVSTTGSVASSSRAGPRPKSAVPRPGLLDKFIDNKWGSNSYRDGDSEYGSSIYTRGSTRASSRRSSFAASQVSTSTMNSRRPHTAHPSRRLNSRGQSRGANRERPRTAFGTTISAHGPHPDDRFREARGTMPSEFTKPITLEEFGGIEDAVLDQVGGRDKLNKADIPTPDMNPDHVTLEAPAARRKQLHEQLDRQEEARRIRAELGRKAKAVEVMRQTSRYPQGFLTDASANQHGRTDTFRDRHSVFAGKAQAILEKRHQREQVQSKGREEHLRTRQNATVQGFLTDDKNVPSEPKRKAKGGGIQRDNGNLFTNMLLPAPEAINAEARKTAIRNQESNGRNYDVISNVVTKHYPPSIEEKKVPRKLHPSLFT